MPAVFISLSCFISSLSEIGKTPPNARISINLDKISFCSSLLPCFIFILCLIAVLASSRASSILYSFIKIDASSFFMISSLIVLFIRTSVTSATPVSSSRLGALSFSMSPFGFQFSPSHKKSISFFCILFSLFCFFFYKFTIVASAHSKGKRSMRGFYHLSLIRKDLR